MPTNHMKSVASRVASAYLARRAYDEKGRDPEEGWQHGVVEPFVPTEGVGSQVPPARDNQGAPIELPPLETLEIPGYEWHNKSKAFHSVDPAATQAKKAGAHLRTNR